MNLRRRNRDRLAEAGINETVNDSELSNVMKAIAASLDNNNNHGESKA